MPKVKLNTKPMHVPPPVPRQYFSITVPASEKDTQIVIDVALYQRDGSSWVDLQPLLGDGMSPPNQLRYQGKQHELPPQQWHLLYILQNEYGNRLPQEKVMRALWPDGSGCKQSLKTAVKELRKTLTKINHEMTVNEKDGWVILNYPD